MKQTVALVASLTATLFAQQPPRGVTLSGRIVDALYEGAPAAEVWVTAADGAVLARTAADGEGYYLLQRLPEVPMRLHARGDALAEATIVVNGHGRDRAASLQLEAGRALEGTVLLHDGRPAAGADVIAFDVDNSGPDSPRSWSAIAVTDADGKWQVKAAPLRPLLVRAFTPGHAIAEAQVARAHAGRVQLQIPEGRLYERRVRIDGMPTGTRVVLRNQPNGRFDRTARLWPARMTSAEVHADGTATMWPLPVSHDLRVDAPGHRSYPLMVMCEAGNCADRRFSLSPIPAAISAPSTTLRGRLVDSLGQPLGGQTLVGAVDDQRGPTCRTGDDGSFELVVPVREKVLCRIGLLSPLHQLGGIDCELGNDGVSWRTVAADPRTPLRLDAATAVSLHCPVRTDDGAALVTTAIELRWHGAGQGRAVTVSSATDRRGELHLEGLVPGSYQLTATRHDGLRVSRLLLLAPDEPVTELVLPLPAGGVLTGLVRDAAGKPVPSATVTLAHLRVVGGRGGARPRPGRAQIDPDSMRHIVCDRDGRFRIPHAAAGDWLITDDANRFRGMLQAEGETITVEPGRNNEVTFVIGR